MVITTLDFYRQAIQFANELVTKLEGIGIRVDEFPIDHICYRVPSVEEYGDMKEFLAKQGTLLVETPINGRPISTYKLTAPVQYDNPSGFTIPCIELPAPKTGRTHAQGFEHAEFVVPSADRFAQMYPQHTFKTDNPGGNNLTLSLDLDWFVAKFHEQPLEVVIQRELAQILEKRPT
ncbi:VOC family protein [Candidatus Woesearchaeota archaeon]|nr:VOC family protein [Candidatus Woesearchaeota archaeon]